MRARRSRARWALSVALLLAAMVSGCGGSALTPAEVYAANALAADPALPVRPGVAETTGGQERPDAPSAPGSGPTRASGDEESAQPGEIAAAGSRAASTPPPAAGSAAACTRLPSQPGIDDDTVTLANVSDISGPIPGIFRSAQQGAKAYVAYFNATSSLCGHRLELVTYDSRTDAGGNQVAYTRACAETFAAVGSMSAFDLGGVATAQRCGLPDLRATSVSDAANACTTCFGAQATDLHAFQNAVPDFLLAHHRDASRHAAIVYVDEQASVLNATTMRTVQEKRGMHFVYSTSFNVAEFNYAPYVQRLKDAGARIVEFVGSSDQAVRLARAMQEAAYQPEVFLLDPTAYDPMFVGSGGKAVDGATVFIDFTPFEEASRSAELRLYEQWLHQVSPGASPSYFGLFAWSATRLLVEQAVALGPRLTRARLVDRLRQVHAWTSHGLHAAQDVGGKRNSNCWRFLQLRDGVWHAVGGRDYLCHGETRAG